jgi:hypothetical protein
LDLLREACHDVRGGGSGNGLRAARTSGWSSWEVGCVITLSLSVDCCCGASVVWVLHRFFVGCCSPDFRVCSCTAVPTRSFSRREWPDGLRLRLGRRECASTLAISRQPESRDGRGGTVSGGGLVRRSSGETERLEPK